MAAVAGFRQMSPPKADFQHLQHSADHQQRSKPTVSTTTQATGCRPAEPPGKALGPTPTPLNPAILVGRKQSQAACNLRSSSSLLYRFH